ncbi:hypothetical protein [Burkholderia sp. ABCPW 111]|uniref:hypothetical protein n=1 Tax=Burkholderia sp. ABCPW 111 TaxID=1820025 RepID=UPI00126A5C5B|nr:hypothetical protein [Burkholderia sp. ABCPW 111]
MGSPDGEFLGRSRPAWAAAMRCRFSTSNDTTPPFPTCFTPVTAKVVVRRFGGIAMPSHATARLRHRKRFKAPKLREQVMNEQLPIAGMFVIQNFAHSAQSGSPEFERAISHTIPKKRRPSDEIIKQNNILD